MLIEESSSYINLGILPCWQSLHTRFLVVYIPTVNNPYRYRSKQDDRRYNKHNLKDSSLAAY